MKQIRVYLPHESQPCSYLPQQRSRSLYVDPHLKLDQQELSLLSQNGFRRSGRVVYRPECPSCNACQSVRIQAQQLTLSRSHRRILKKNRDLTLKVELPVDGALHYPTYKRYINERHSDGDMYPPHFEQYQGFLLEDFGNTRFLSACLGEKLIGSLVFDVLDDGLSSVYCFFEPEQSERSPAMFLILSLTILAHGLKLPFNYLGYQVDGCQKMAYKTRFSPQDAFINDEWRPKLR